MREDNIVTRICLCYDVWYKVEGRIAMKEKLKKIQKMAQKFIHQYFVEQDIEVLLGMMSDYGTWSGFQNDPKVYSKEVLREKLNEVFVEEGSKTFRFEKEDYKIFSYSSGVVTIKAEIWGYPIVLEVTQELLHLTFELSFEELEPEKEKIVQVIVSPIFNLEDDSFYKQLVEKSEKLSRISALIPSGLMSCKNDEDFHIITIDEDLCRMLGYTKEMLLKKCNGKAGELIYKKDYNQVIKEIRTQFLSANEYICKYRMERSDGKLAWVWETGIMLPNDNGEEILQCILLDISQFEKMRWERDTVFDNIPGGIAYFFIDDEDFVLYDANDNFYQMLGVEREEYEGGGKRYMYPEDIPHVREHFCKQSALREPIDCEFRVKRPGDGNTVWYHILGSCYSEVADKKEYLCVFLDVTDKHKAMMEVAKEKERYRLAMQNTSDIVFEYDIREDSMLIIPKEGQVEYQLCMKMGKYKNWRNKILEKDLIFPEDREKIREILVNMKECDADDNYVFELRGKTQPKHSEKAEYQWYHIHATAVYENGEKVRIVGMVQNIEQQKKLKSTNDALKQIFDLQLIQNFERIIQVDAETGKYKLYSVVDNWPCEKPKEGFHDEQVIYMSENYVYKGDVERYKFSINLERIREVLKSGEQSVLRYFRILSANGKYRWKCYCFNYMGADVSTILISVQDVHDIRLEEQKQEESNRKLLMNALEEAKRSSQMRWNFFEMMTKEFRAPLSMLADISRNPDLSESGEAEQILKKVYEVSSYLSKTIGDMVELNQLERGGLRVTRENTDLRKLVLEIYNKRFERARTRGVELEMKISIPEENLYFVDAFRIHQVLSNVLENAIRFSDRGSKVKCFVDEKQNDDDSFAMTVSVEDTGAYISEAYFERVYGEELEDEFSDEYSIPDGMGFSLSLCRKIAELMGGKARVFHGNGRSNYFYLEIPVEYASNGEENGESVAVGEDVKPEADLSPYHILLVENPETQGSLHGALLKINGAKVVMAGSGEEALQCIKQSSNFSVVLINNELSDMSYMQLAAEIRKNEKESSPGIPIFSIGDNFLVEDIKEGYQIGINGNLTKPLNMQKLLQLFRAMEEGIL